MASSPNKALFDLLSGGLGETKNFVKEKTRFKEVPAPKGAPEIDAKTLVRIREAMDMTQEAFAKVLEVTSKEVESWEKGTKTPSKTVCRLLQILVQQPALVCRTVGVPSASSLKLRSFTVITRNDGIKHIVNAK